jgi:hypothetical protein
VLIIIIVNSAWKEQKMSVHKENISAITFCNPNLLDSAILKRIALSFDSLMIVGLDQKISLDKIQSKVTEKIYIDNLIIDRIQDLYTVPEFVFEAEEAMRIGITYHPILFNTPKLRYISSIYYARVINFGRRNLLVKRENLPRHLDANDLEQYEILENNLGGIQQSVFDYTIAEEVMRLTKYQLKNNSVDSYFDAGFHVFRIVSDLIAILGDMQKDQVVATCFKADQFELLIIAWKLVTHISDRIPDFKKRLLSHELSDPIDISKLGYLTMGIIESVVDKKEIIKRTYGEIRKYKEANQPAYERFAEYVKSCVHELDDLDESSTIINRIRKMIDTDVTAEARRIRDEMAEVWSKMFTSVGVKAAGTILTSGGSILSALTTGNIGMTATLGGMAGSFLTSIINDVTGAIQDGSKVRKHGLAYLLRI